MSDLGNCLQQYVMNEESIINLSTSGSRLRIGSSKRLTNEERDEITNTLLLNYQNGKLKHGVLKQLCQQYSVSRMTMSTIWKQVNNFIKDNKVPRVRRKYKGNQKPIARAFSDVEKVREIPLQRRTNLKSLAYALNTSISNVGRLVMGGKIRRHSNCMKPFLNEEHKKKRLVWVLQHIDMQTLHVNPEFVGMYDEVHIDEKWFFMSKASENYYMLPGETEPHRTITNKKFITKIIFMGAVARPRFNEDGECHFDGKIGIFPFTFTVPAKRASKNRAKGVLETKAIEHINREIIKERIIQKVIPAIKRKWPLGCISNIKIVQDNAKPHIADSDPDFIKAGTSDGFHITLTQQPPCSPDCNINDLGFFRVIQGIQHEKAPRTICQLIDAVLLSYEEIKPETLNYVWLSLQCVMNEILKCQGNKNFKSPHMGKKKLAKQQILPGKLQVCKDLVLKVMQEMQPATTEGNAEQGTQSEQLS